MSSQKLPTPKEAYYLLRDTGEMFTVDHPAAELAGISYRNSDGNLVKATIDTKVLQVIQRMYARSGKLQAALKSFGVSVAPAVDLKHAVAAATRTGIVWGISGYATPSRIVGKDYSAEAGAIEEIYTELSGMRKPKLVIDGAVCVGVLGLNGAIAAQKSIETVGVIPLEGLTNMGPRTKMVIWGNTYQDREKLVGSLADILLCIGGGKGTENECRETISQQGIAVIISPRKYAPGSFPETFRDDKILREAEGKRLFVCGPNDSIASCLDTAIKAHLRIGFRSRSARLANTLQLLDKSWP